MDLSQIQTNCHGTTRKQKASRLAGRNDNADELPLPVNSQPDESDSGVEEKAVDKLPDNLMPPNIDEDWRGCDLSKRYIINADGTIIIDHTKRNNCSLDRTIRNDLYQGHKRYAERNVCTESPVR